MSTPECDHDSEQGDRKLIHDVQTHGWHVVKILPEGLNPAWAFSVGLYRTFNHPEVVMFGLGLEIMHLVINDVGDRVRAGNVLVPDVEAADLLEGYTCVFKPIAPVWFPYVLGYAQWFYDGQPFPALQCIWPDRHRRFPWQKGFDESLNDLQPLLFHDEPGAARAEGLISSMTPEPRGPSSK